MVNTTGWNELLAGHPVQASFAFWNYTLGGWVIPILFIVYQTIAYYKSRSPLPGFIGGSIATFVYHIYVGGFTDNMLASTTPIYIMYVLLSFQLGIIIYTWIIK